MAKKVPDASASTYDKLQAKEAGETLKNRDVFHDQQVDRSKIGGVESKTSRTVLSVAASVLVFLLAWLLLSAAFAGISSAKASFGGGDAVGSYYEYTPGRMMEDLPEGFLMLDEEGERTGEWFATEEEAEAAEPQWHVDAVAEQEAKLASGEVKVDPTTFGGWVLQFSWIKLLLSLIAAGGVGSVVHAFLMRNLSAQNLLRDTSDINQHEGDQHVATPGEIMAKFEWFPDVGMHTSALPSSMISHVMLQNKGLSKIVHTRFYEKDLVVDGEVEAHAGEPMYDDAGELMTDLVPMIDESFGDDLFDASGLPSGKAGKGIRVKYDATGIEYNPDGLDRDKLGAYKTVADMINAEWVMPWYEPQRPAGAYIVDTAPVNTMVLAITRAGKGQTYIEPMIDMWLRERQPNNMVINDPKGELLVKNYVRATMRGFQVIQFNLINAMKTDIYNPLGMAAEAAREGDSVKTAEYVNNIGDVFFPLDGGDDPVWPNAANNAFKRAAYGLIDFYLEEERELRSIAARTGMAQKVLETKIDAMWGKVTLYNCYRLFVDLSAKKMKNPGVAVEKAREAGEFRSQEEYDEAYAESGAILWEGQPEKDMLSLFFSATAELPMNSMRTLISNADNALKAMAGAEKMLASVYGIAITAMSFFADPTISALTSGTPSQNTDLGGLSFPRRMGVRFSPNFLKRDNLVGAQVIWDAFADAMYTEPLGKDFHHEDTIGTTGWARYYFKGKFPEMTSYLRLELRNARGMLIRTFYFKFTKDYQASLNGRYYVTDPITDEKIIRNGVLVEMREVKRRSDDSVVGYKQGYSTFPQVQLTDVTSHSPKTRKGRARTIISTNVRYSEQPKVVFLVTPPHLMKYAKLILILLKQLVDLNFDKSYMTKSNQKPLYKTRFMLDELGNLQSEGNGISGFETMLSIGLGQEQQFTLILQTLQQLRDVYGDSVDKIVQGNTSNIVFLKSTDDSMLDTLTKMSGTRHTAYIDSKTVTKDQEKLIKGVAVEGKVSYTMSVKEEPVIAYNDMAFIAERNSIVFRAGDAPVWNRNELILPMSWRLFKDFAGGNNGIVHPGRDYSLQTIPTLSSALEFDVAQNQPNFELMVSRRMEQAKKAAKVKEIYKTAYNLDDAAVSRLNQDVYSDEIMGLIDSINWSEAGGALAEAAASDDSSEDGIVEVDFDEYEGGFSLSDDEILADYEMLEKISEAEEKSRANSEKIYAGGTISREMFLTGDGSPKTKALDREVIEAYTTARPYMERDIANFSVDESDGSLMSADRRHVYISPMDESEARAELKRGSEDPSARVFSDAELADMDGFHVHPELYRFLGGLSTWSELADGQFEDALNRAMLRKENEVLVS